MPKRKSEVWKFFNNEEDNKVAKCYLCGKSYSTGGGTSNLLDHLRRFHKDHINAAGHISSNITMYGENDTLKKEINKALIKFVVSHMQPFSIVENTEFQNFVKTLNPRYCLPNRHSLANDILEEAYTKMKQSLLSELEGVTSVALTTDAWSSNRQDPFLAVTAHFVKDEKLISSCLECCLLREQHTSDNLSAVLNDIIIKWGIVGRVAAVVTDNAPNMVAAVKKLSIRHVPCVAHTLNLMVLDSLKGPSKMATLLELCCQTVTYFKQSNVANETLRSYQEAAGKPKLRLIQQVPTRWNSQLEMARRLLEVKNELILAQSNLRNAPRTLTAEEWQQLEEMINVVSPLETMTKVLSGEQYVTCSQIIPLIHGLHLELVKVMGHLVTDVAMTFASSIISSLETRLFPYEQRSVPRLATFLDPRFKKLAFRLPERAEDARKQAEGEIAAFIRKQEGKVGGKELSQPTESASPNTFGGGLFNFLAERTGQLQRTSTATSDAAICVRQYSEKPPEPANTDPLTYWIREDRTNGISDVALWYLSVPATSVPAERVFSKAGKVITDRRNSLSPERASKLIFMNSNIRLLD